MGANYCISKIDARLNQNFIVEQTAYNINDDPEINLFHPSKTLSDLLKTVGKSYNKSKGDVSSFESHITKQDYEALLKSDRCAAFNSFITFI